MSPRVSFLSFMAGALAMSTCASVAAEPKAVVELFTSQGCSSCPPADRLAAELTRDPKVIVLSLPVDYWDYLGWKDTLASPRYSARQRAYAKVRGDRDVYTPQVVVNGGIQVLGSDKAAIDSAVAQSRAKMTIPVTLSKADGRLTVSVADGNGQGEVWLCGIARSVPVTISRGENSGHVITYSNVGRRLIKLGDWNGKAQTWTVPLKDIGDDGVDAAAAMVQTGTSEKPGVMLGAAFATLN